jgi:hypothetical protein
VDLLAQARIAALTARADEALTLVARGSGGDFDTGFNVSMKTLAGDGSGGLLAQASDAATDPVVRSALDAARADTKAWLDAHKKLRDQDTGGNYSAAVKLAISGDPGSSAAAFNQLDTDLANGIARASAAFDREAKTAATDFTGAVPGLVALTLLLLAGLVAGVQQRIAEYR